MRVRVWHVFVILGILVLIGVAMLFAAWESKTPGCFHRWLSLRPLSFWIMSWFLVTASLLTAIGTFFRGPGWSWVWPWSA